MEYVSLEKQKYFAECQKLIESIGYVIVEFHIVPAKNTIKVSIVISHKSEITAIGINDCAKVHRLLLPFLEENLHSDDIHMEVTSPGMERTLKNAAEFSLFLGRDVKVWYTEISDWINGLILSADDKSVTVKIDGTGEEKSFPYENIAKAKLLHMEG